MDTLNEVMTTQQRIKRAMIMARNRSKIERARERSRARLADAKKIVERAMRLARQIVRKRVVGERGERYEDLSPAEKVEIDKVMQKRKDAIKKVALRLIQQVRKKEFERFKSFYMGKQLDHLHTESVELDVGKLLYEMIEAVQDNLITEADRQLLEANFGDHEDFDLFKSYFVESLALEEGDSEMAMLRVSLLENLDDWFNEKWVRVDTKGNIKGDCAREEGEGKPKCLPFDRARGMSKEDRARAARRKRRQDSDVDRPGTGNKPINVATESFIVEKSVPKNPKLWARAKAWAKSEYDVYPSAYANAGAAKWYKKHGGTWIAEETLIEALVRRSIGATKFSLAGNIKSDSTIARRSRRSATKVTGGIRGGTSLIRRRIIDRETGKVRTVEPSDYMRKITQARLRTAARALSVGDKSGTSYYQQHTPSTSNRSRISVRTRRPM